ncbi:NAD(P)H-binding protein [Silvimonas soli]|uniref:NAD(P)H-binding protein n=1 Tax=Silvimonas soli TaxID=2980100 RepID=UPI0024B34BD5|nr:NAD(P)H-binding protein [Silvimonas soli]
MFVILGASGKTGGATAAALRKAGRPVRAVVRDPARAGALQALGCEIAIADVRDKTALVKAMAGATAVQVFCPTSEHAVDAVGDMRRAIASVGDALDLARPAAVLAISDYGAEHSTGTGVTGLFHELEQRMRRIASAHVVLRSAEHMENWSRLIPVAAQTGMLPSLHHPVTKYFPTVSSADVGVIAAQLLLSSATFERSGGVIHAEGPSRYTVTDVAQVLGDLLDSAINAFELLREQWQPTLARGVGESYARLVTEMYDAHNAGHIGAQEGVDDIRYGQTSLHDALKPYVTALLATQASQTGALAGGVLR